MDSAEARIATPHAQRYLAQLCRHAAAIGGRGGHLRMLRHKRHGGEMPAHDQLRIETQSTRTEGTIRLDPYGTCRLTADDGELVVRIEAAEPDKLARIQQILTADLERFGGRREQLVVRWRQDGQGEQTQNP
jgi:hypothetical protein